MNHFPKSRDEFYALRDDRTNRCGVDQRYQNVACAVQLAPSVASTVAGQTMLIVAANLLSRWCRRVTIRMEPTMLHPALRMGDGDLGELVLSQMRDADPFGAFEIAVSQELAVQVALYIGGDHRVRPGLAAAFIDASGWLASVSTQHTISLATSDDHNRIGAIAAACLGVAQVFKMALEMPSTNHLRDGIFDVFRLNWSSDRRQAPWPADLTVGNLLMAGAGSVGSSAAYCMRLSGLAGAMTVVDEDSVKIENFNRSPIFGRRNVGLTKAHAVAEFLAGSGLSGKAVPLWWNDFIEKRARASFDFDVWLPLANEFGVRLAMQHSVPPLMIHASTSSNWGVNHGRHIPGRDDCLADRFPVEVSPDHLACSTARVETAGVVADAALPFASMFAGVLIATDLVRGQLPDYPQVPNFALLDWYGRLDTIQAWDWKPRAGCICREQGRLQERLNAKTRHRRLFQFM